MNRIINIIVCASLLFFTACDKVEGPYFEAIQQEEVTATFPPIDPATVYNKIYFEEFTGHLCVNCPEAQDLLTDLQTKYGDTLIVMAIHTTNFARPFGADFQADYRTTEGDEMGSNATVTAAPAGWPNRVGEIASTSYSGWESLIMGLQQKSPAAAIQMITELENDQLKVNSKISVLNEITSPVLYALYVIESGIVSPQKNGNETIYDYEHNHMLRGTITNAFGNRITEDGYVAVDSAYTNAYSITLKPEWVTNNCSVIGMLVDEESKVVLQSEIVHLGSHK